MLRTVHEQAAVSRAEALTLEQARSIAAAQPARPPQQLPLEQAIGCLLAQAVTAQQPIPHSDTSAMDGWAVCGEQPEEGWQMLPGGATSPADLLPALGPGQAIEVVTGTPVPQGTDSVLRSEHAVIHYKAQRLRAVPGTGDLQPGRHIRPRGAEAAQGDQLLAKGQRLTPLRGAAAAVAGCDTLAVHPTPTVRIIATGTEVITAGLPGPGQVRDSFSMTLPALLTAMGAAPQTVSRNQDDPTALAAAFTAVDTDLLVTVGGTAHSAADPVRPALAEAGAETLISSVDMRPGHPVTLARLPPRALPHNTLVLALPGNPLAGYAALIAVGQVLIDALAGAVDPLGMRQQYLRAAQDLEPARRGTRLLPVTVDPGGVRPSAHHSPHMMRGLAQAAALAVVPSGGVPAGAQVRCLPLPTQELPLWAG
ncbi:molybdopterin molybdenumtransferase MoeA [Nesterenkonia alkaliphila]|uniref:Molybdopterin molybdenumtransferase n=1 Tax=Nesterenkonia alkaliphila TaxID=1463631 RepID=A0A7K1UMJ8_9MICC|nr:molybdopterin molybdotransferase MoeA [Nesterenkonia alkaliphila]MVT27261.1 molybdopterin molybdenumtransferase MoeA [Nesterenkonia alkaliphila]